jgi:Amt family ammonium transporter
MVLGRKHGWRLLTATAIFFCGQAAFAAEPPAITSASALALGRESVIGWTLIAAFLVVFMQTGFAMIETGLCRAKNAAHTMSMNLMVFALSALGFWFYGFALGWGDWIHGPFFLAGLTDPGVLALFFFTMTLANIAAVIPTGVMAERWRWKNFCLYGLWAALPFGIYAHWIWGGGWLAAMGTNWHLGHGAVDFAGSGAVHALGGVIGLAGAVVLGPRIGKYSLEGRPFPIPAHHLPMVVVGTLVLVVGWFGFNSGFVLTGVNVHIGTIVVNTALAGAAGAVAAMLTLQLKGMKSDTTLMCNGILSGLVAVSASCAFVDGWAAAMIGAVAGVLAVFGVFFWERHHIDDPVGAISVHGLSGLWGVVALGLFANGKCGDGWNGVAGGVRGALYGDVSQLYAQLLDAAVVAVFGFLMAYVWFKLSNRITPIRVSIETEMVGLDGPEMGAIGYPDFTVGSRS